MEDDPELEASDKIDTEIGQTIASQEQKQDIKEVTSDNQTEVPGDTVQDAQDNDNKTCENNSQDNQVDTPKDAEDGPSANSEHSQYKQHIHYEGELAVYTDPSTKVQYIWSQSDNQWTVRTEANSSETPGASAEGSYGYEGNTHTYTDAEGITYLWDADKKAWFPKVDDEFIAHYQLSYGLHPLNLESASEKAKKEDEKNKKADEANSALKRKAPEDPKWFEVDDTHNTKVYVSNLPLNITEEEFLEVMQKCGLIMRDLNTGKMKIKLYTKPNSTQLKGDGLCTYIKKESVDLALSILDGYAIRNHKIKVQRAKFQMKGEYNPALKPKKKKKDKEKMKKMQEKLFDWRPEKTHEEVAKHEKVVIIKNLFEPKLFDEQVELILEYQQDMREECSKCGEVKKVVIYDMHPEGVAQITMKEAEEATKVVELINGRWFGKRQLSAEIWDGKTKYKMEETAADIDKRLSKWNEFLSNADDETPVPSENKSAG